MGFVINDEAVAAAYNKLSNDQKENFFPGEAAQVRKIVGSLGCLLESVPSYDQMLELYITAAVRAMMGFENERINITVKMRFSDIVPDSLAITVIECIRRLYQNFSYIEKANSPEMQAFDKFFDTQNEAAIKRNEKNADDATQKPGFGTDPGNPIYAHSSAGAYAYLNLLYTPDLVPLTWNRIGSIRPDSDSKPLDMYELLLPNGNVYMTVYVNMYARKASIYCPAGLYSDELDALPPITVQSPKTHLEPEEPSEEDEYLAFLQQYGNDSEQAESTHPSPAEQQAAMRRKTSEDSHRQQQSADEMLTERVLPILQGNAPVLHIKSAIYKTSNGSIYAICTFSPITNISIRAMQVDVICYNVWHEQLATVDSFQYLDLETQRYSAFGSNIAIPLPDSNTRNVEVKVRRIMFADKTMLQREGDNIELPALETLDSYFTSKELLEEYKQQTYPNVRYTPVKVGAFWRCTCGALNRDDEASCEQCKDSSEKLFSWMDEERLQISLDERKGLQREKEERELKAREEAQQKAAEEARIYAEKKKQCNKTAAICAAAAALIALIIYLIGWQAIPAYKYKKADALILAGDREAAFSAFTELDGYKDSQNRASAIHYEDAAAAFSAGDYDSAYSLFSGLGEYDDSSTQAKESLYQKALVLMGDASYEDAARDSESDDTKFENETLHESGKYKEAGELFETLEGYRDSSTMALRAYYLCAADLIGDGKLHEAYQLLSSKVNKGSEGYEDSINLANEAEYQYASECFAAGNYADAAESFANLKDYKESAKRADELSYQHGLALIEAKEYDEAITVLGRLSDYRDSMKKYNEARYQKALQLMGQKRYQDAERIFEELGNYSDSAKQKNECAYQCALGLVRDEKYIQAAAIFKELGDYSDSVNQWKSTMYSYVLAHNNNNDNTTYEYLQALSNANYKDSKSIYERLYSWSASVAINASESDFSTTQTSFTTYNTIYCHITLQGGPQGEYTTIQVDATYPDGYCSTVRWGDDEMWERDSYGTAYFWFDNPDHAKKGIFTVKVYAGLTLIAQESVQIT